MNINSLGSYGCVGNAATQSRRAPAEKGSFGEALSSSFRAADTFTRTPVTEEELKAAQSRVGYANGVAETTAKLDKIDKELAEMDYSGMSREEIYFDIENRYQEAFDDFQGAVMVCGCKERVMINNRYEDNIEKYVKKLSGLSMEKLNELRGYSGSDFEAVEAEVKKKYAGKTGFVDQLNLFGELCRTGVLNHKYGSEKVWSMICDLNIAAEFKGEGQITREEWNSRIEASGAKSPFAIMMSMSYIPQTTKDFYEQMINDILFDIGEE